MRRVWFVLGAWSRHRRQHDPIALALNRPSHELLVREGPVRGPGGREHGARGLFDDLRSGVEQLPSDVKTQPAKPTLQFLSRRGTR